MVVTPTLTFRFDKAAHEYIALDTGEVLPHITGLLERGGFSNDVWYDEEDSERGRAVHALTADYDLGSLTDVVACDSKYKGWLLAHVNVMAVMRPRMTLLAVEEPIVHHRYRFGGRPDRVMRFDGALSVLDIKSGHEDARAHGVQTALQAILVAQEYGLPATSIVRYLLYLKQTGRGRLIEAKNRRDFDKANELIRDFCGRR